jgi:hypothetical protein
MTSQLPIIFELERESFLPLFDHISIYPAFYSDRHAPCQTIADSFDGGFQDTFGMGVHKAHVSRVTIFLKDFSDVNFMRHVVEDVAVSFPAVSRLAFAVERLDQTVSFCFDDTFLRKCD